MAEIPKTASKVGNRPIISFVVESSSEVRLAITCTIIGIVTATRTIKNTKRPIRTETRFPPICPFLFFTLIITSNTGNINMHLFKSFLYIV